MKRTSLQQEVGRKRYRVLDMRLGVAGIIGATLVTGLVVGAPAASAQTKRVYATDLTDIASAANGGRIIESSSTYNDDTSYGAANLIGGKVFDPNEKSTPNGWVSNKYDPINMESVTIGFADNALKTIGKIVLNPSTAVTPERWAKDIEMQVSTESAQGPYRAVAQITLKRVAQRQEFLIFPAAARFVKLVVRSNWGSDRAIGLGSVEMYESISNTDPVGELVTRLEGAVNDLRKFRDSQNEMANATGNSSLPVSAPTPQLTNAAQFHAQMSVANRVSSSDSANRVIFIGSEINASSTGSALQKSGRAVNIAAAANGGKIVDVSSTFNNDADYNANNLIDGQNFSTSDGKGSAGWASEGFVSGEQSVTIGFRDDRTHVISKLVLNPVSKQNSLRWASRVEVQVTNDDAKSGPYRTVATLNLRQRAENQDFAIGPVEAKYVRFVFVGNGPGNPLPQGDPNVSSDRAVSLGEIEIYEPAISSAELDSLVTRFNQVLVDLKTLRSKQKIGDSTDSGDSASTENAPLEGTFAAPKTP